MGEISDYIETFRERGYRAEDAALFERAWDCLEAAYLERLAEVSRPHHTWRERFRAASAETFRLVEEYPRQARFLTVDSLVNEPLGRQRQRALRQRLVELVDAAREELQDPEAIPSATAPWVVAIFFDRIYRHLAGDPLDSLEAQLPGLMFLAISAYFGTEAGLMELSSRS